jgi:hypothetical protein
MTLTPAQLGFIRALGVSVIFAALAFIGNAANLNGVVPEGLAAIISMIALSIEHSMEAKGKGALFGAVRTY